MRVQMVQERVRNHFQMESGLGEGGPGSPGVKRLLVRAGCARNWRKVLEMSGNSTI